MLLRRVQTVCLRAWRALPPSGKTEEVKRRAEEILPTGVEKNEKGEKKKATAVASCKTDYSAGKLYSREVIILKSKGPISWLTFMKELKLH